MQQHLEQVLQTAGLPADVVKTLVELPADAKDFKPEDHVVPIRTAVETAVKNDPKFYEGLNKDNLPKEFVQQLEREQYGRSAAQVRTNMIKALGLKDDDFKDLGEEGKKIEVFGPAFAKKIAEGKVTDKELQQKLIEAQTQIDTLTNQGTELEKKYQGEAAKTISEYQFASGVLTQLASVNGLKAPAKIVSNHVITTLKSKYGFEIVDGVIELRQKANPTLKVLTADNKELTLGPAINMILEAEELIEKKGTKTTTVTTDVTTDTGKGLKMHSGVKSKIEKRKLEDEKAGGATA